MRRGLERVREAIRLQDYGSVSASLQDLEPVFRQHIADEESQILRVLIGSLGTKGAAEEIRVFQQHRPIHLLMQKVSELASRPTAELPEEREELERLLDSHFLAEENEVFPKALECASRGSGAS